MTCSKEETIESLRRVIFNAVKVEERLMDDYDIYGPETDINTFTYMLNGIRNAEKSFMEYLNDFNRKKVLRVVK
jgi:hypothetical protein